jgi:hypothetical protein
MANRANLAGSIELLDSPEKLQNVGYALVREAIARTVLQRAQKSALPHGLVIKKGEIVPESFQKALNIKVDAAGKALGNWPAKVADGDYFEVCYEDAGVGYCECWPDSPDFNDRLTAIGDPWLKVMGGLTRAELAKNFSKEEINLLEKHNLINTAAVKGV